MDVVKVRVDSGMKSSTRGITQLIVAFIAFCVEKGKRFNERRKQCFVTFI